MNTIIKGISIGKNFIRRGDLNGQTKLEIRRTIKECTKVLCMVTRSEEER